MSAGGPRRRAGNAQIGLRRNARAPGAEQEHSRKEPHLRLVRSKRNHDSAAENANKQIMIGNSKSATTRFSDQKDGFRQILSDPHWLAKILLGGFLLINPFLIALAPAYFSGTGPAWVARVFPWILGFNVASFWFPLGFTYEVLRRARTSRGRQLPDWRIDRLAVFAHEGSVKLVLATFTLILPAAIWMGACYGLFVYLLGLPPALLSLFVPPALLFLIPFCAVACCRWLDGHSVLSAR